jgi:hypothetical protein
MDGESGMCLLRIAIHTVLILFVSTLSQADSTHASSEKERAIELEGYIPPLEIVARADTETELSKVSSPTIDLPDGFLWISHDAAGQFKFVIGSPQRVRIKSGPPFWALMRLSATALHSEPSEELETFYHSNIGSFVADLPLVKSVPISQDGGAGGEFAMLLAEDGQNNQIYELGHFAIFSASGSDIEQRRLFVLHGCDGQLKFIGEGPREVNHYGDVYFSQSSIYSACFGSEKHKDPLIKYTSLRTWGSTSNRDEPTTELNIYREGVLGGSSQTQYRWTTRPYVKAEANTSLRSIAETLAQWQTPASSDLASYTDAVVETIKRLNPNIEDPLLHESTVFVPSNDQLDTLHANDINAR